MADLRAHDTYPQTGRTSALRNRDQVAYQRTAVHAALDEAYLCHLAFTIDGGPRILPTLQVRIDETLYLHGSTGSRPMLAARSPEGLAVCVAVTLLDGLVYARAQFHHSANYRSVIAHGVARLVTDHGAKRRALAAFVDKLGAGRAADSRAPDAKELAETAVLALPLHEASIKSRTGGVNEDPGDFALPHWAGVVPLRTVAGVPVPDPGVHAPPPAYLPTAVDG